MYLEEYKRWLAADLEDADQLPAISYTLPDTYLFFSCSILYL